MATIDWGKTIWASVSAGGTTRTSSSLYNADTNSSIMLRDSSNVLDSSSAIISGADIPSGKKTVYLGTTGVDATTSVASAQAETSKGDATNAFAKAEYEVTSNGEAKLTTLTLLGVPQVGDGADASKQVGTSIILASNSLTKVAIDSSIETVAAPDTIRVDNFGSSGTIDLGGGDDVIVFNAGSDFMGKSIVVDGGIGSDSINANRKNITVKMAAYDKTSHSNDETDKVSGWVEKSGTIQLADGLTFTNLSLTSRLNATAASVGWSFNNSGTATKTVTTNFSVAGDSSNSLVTYISDGSVTKTAMLFGSNAATKIGTDASAINCMSVR